MNAHTASPNGATSFLLEAKRLLQAHADRMGLFHSLKKSKQDLDMNYKRKHYHIQKKEYLPHVIIKMSWK